MEEIGSSQKRTLYAPQVGKGKSQLGNRSSERIGFESPEIVRCGCSYLILPHEIVLTNSYAECIVDVFDPTPKVMANQYERSTIRSLQ